MNFTRLENETDEELIYRICSNKDVIGSWQDVADVINKITGNDFGESTYRKKFQAFEKLLNANQSKFCSIENHVDVINEQRRELEKERKKLQTEKIEYNKWLREEARDEMILEQIRDAVRELKPLDVPYKIEPDRTTKAFCLVFGDEHFGAEFELRDMFGEIINEYSPEIFEERMSVMLTKTIELIKKENIKELNVFNMGDFCDGVLRVSQLMKLRYGIVDGTIKYANYIANWLNALTRYVSVKFQMTDGNHTELRMIGQPKGTFTEDNMGKVVKEIIKIRLERNPNFTLIDNPSGYIYAQLACHTVLGIHGEVKNASSAIKEFSQMYGFPIQYLIMGHLHHSRTEEVAENCEVINVPSVIGMDGYAMSLRKSSSPAAKLLVFDQLDGLVCDYRIKLN